MMYSACRRLCNGWLPSSLYGQRLGKNMTPVARWRHLETWLPLRFAPRSSGQITTAFAVLCVRLHGLRPWTMREEHCSGSRKHKPCGAMHSLVIVLSLTERSDSTTF